MADPAAQKKKLTVASLLALKNIRQVVLTTAFDEWTARAAEEAGVDMILAWGENLEHTKFILAAVRKGAPNTLIGSGLPHPAYASEENCLTLAGEIRLAGTDIVYCSGLVPDKFAAMARQHVPCCGHVGYLPCNNTWLGGPRAVGKSHEEAKRVYNEVMEVSERSERALDRQWRAMPLSWTVPEQSLCAKRCAWPNPPPCSNLDVLLKKTTHFSLGAVRKVGVHCCRDGVRSGKGGSRNLEANQDASFFNGLRPRLRRPIYLLGGHPRNAPRTLPSVSERSEP